jgi:hypothetical protein
MGSSPYRSPAAKPAQPFLAQAIARFRRECSARGADS